MQNRIHTYIRVLAVVLLAVWSTSALLAQKQKIRNLPYYDQRLLHWGFSLGLNMPDITFEHSGSESGEGWWATCPQVNPSFMVGLMGDMAITEHLNFRITPAFYFQQRKVSFARNQVSPIYENILNEDGSVQQVQTGEGLTRQETVQQLKTSYIEIPLSLKVSTRRINNYRPYLVGGLNFGFDLGHAGEEPIVFQRFDYGLHIGLGCDFYLQFFKFAPELRFNLGLRDMIDHERKDLKDETMRPYTDAILSARNTGMSLIFWFE